MLSVKSKSTPKNVLLDKDVLDLLYPVGSVLITTNNNSPQNRLGGTWTRIAQGQVIVGVSDTDSAFYAGKTGGEKNHTLKEAELPHISGNWTIHGMENGTIFYYANGHCTGNVMNNKYQGTGGRTGARSITSPGFAFGGGGAHNNLQPYRTAYYWERTA